MTIDNMHSGAKIGPRVAGLVSRTIIATHNGLLYVKHKLAMMVFHAISDEISAEVDDTLGPVIRDLADKYQADGPLHDLVDFLATNHGQFKAIVGTGLSVSGLLWALATIMNNELADAVYEAVGSNPHLLPDIGTLSQMGASGVVDPGIAVGAMRQQGTPEGWGQAMMQLQKQFPSLPEMLDFIRRGLLSGPDFRYYALRQGIDPNIADMYLGTTYQPLSPADAALAVLRNDISEETGASFAQQWGVAPDTFKLLIGNTGEPLGLEQMLEAYRRGFIDKATLEKGIKESRVRDEWIPTAEALRFTPMSVADAVNSFVQNHLTQDEMRKIASDNGLESGQVDILALTAGEPLSRTEVTELFNRGEMTQAEVDQDLRESRLKDKYVPFAKLLQRKLIEPRMLSEAVQYGAITHDDAIKIALMNGYDEKDAQTIISSGTLRKLQTYRDRVVQAIETMYEDGAISQSEAAAAIKPLNFSDEEADFILQAADFRRASKLTSSAISVIRSKYVGHHITLQEASGALDAAGVPSTQRDLLLNDWQIEEATAVTTLTEAQIVKAVTNQLIPPDEGLARLLAKGYNQTDAQLLLNGA